MSNVKKVVLVSNWPILECMPESVGRPVSEDTLAGRMYEVCDVAEFCEWCADATTWQTLWPEEGEDN